MIKDSLRKWCEIMPKYYNNDDWGRIKIFVRPLGFWRNLPIIKRFCPYTVGGSIKFLIRLTKLEGCTRKFNRLSIWEFLPGENKWGLSFERADIKDNVATMEVKNSGTLTRTGDVVFKLGGINRPGGVPIITTRVISSEYIAFTLFAIVLAVIMTALFDDPIRELVKTIIARLAQ